MSHCLPSVGSRKTTDHAAPQPLSVGGVVNAGFSNTGHSIFRTASLISWLAMPSPFNRSWDSLRYCPSPLRYYHTYGTYYGYHTRGTHSSANRVAQTRRRAFLGIRVQSEGSGSVSVCHVFFCAVGPPFPPVSGPAATGPSCSRRAPLGLGPSRSGATIPHNFPHKLLGTTGGEPC